MIFGLITVKCFYSKSMNTTIFNIKKSELISDIKWWCLKQAFIHVESKNNDSAIGTKHDVGCLQITPIYLKDANRLCNDTNTFTLQDRYNRTKSLEMFDIVQNHYNPGKSVLKAIRIHNPRAKRIYRDSVLVMYKKFLVHYKIKDNV